jgi:hypothetical protein
MPIGCVNHVPEHPSIISPVQTGTPLGDTRCRPAEPVRQLYGIDVPGRGWKIMNIESCRSTAVMSPGSPSFRMTPLRRRFAVGAARERPAEMGLGQVRPCSAIVIRPRQNRCAWNLIRREGRLEGCSRCESKRNKRCDGHPNIANRGHGSPLTHTKSEARPTCPPSGSYHATGGRRTVRTRHHPQVANDSPGGLRLSGHGCGSINLIMPRRILRLRRPIP